VLLVLLIPCCAFAQNAEAQPPKSEKSVTVDFRDVPVQAAVRALFEGTGLSFAFDSGVSGNVNVKLVDVPFSDALDKVLQSANMTMRSDNNVITIGPKKEQTAVATSQPEFPKIDTEPKLAPNLIIEKIIIGPSDVFDIYSMILGTSSNGGSGGRAGGGMGGATGGSTGGGMTGGATGGTAGGGGGAANGRR